METLVNSIIEYLKQVAQPILFLAFVFCILHQIMVPVWLHL